MADIAIISSNVPLNLTIGSKLMTKLLLSIFLLLCFTSHGQYSNGVPYKKVILKDPITNCTYVLDSTHTYVTAYNYHGKFLWNFYTCDGGGGTPDDNTVPIEIYSIKLEGAWLQITDIGCGGYIYVKTGKFNPGECD